jgi:hypothetical protein
MRPEGSLPVVGNVQDHARLEGNLLHSRGISRRSSGSPLTSAIHISGLLSTAIQAAVDRLRRLQFG